MIPSELRKKAYRELPLITDEQEREKYLSELERKASAWWEEEAFKTWYLDHVFAYLLPVSVARQIYKRLERGE